MSATYVPTAYYHETIVCPSPSDWATAASVNQQALKYLADDSKYLVTEISKFWNGTNINVPSGTLTTKGLVVNGSATIVGDLAVFNNQTITGNLQINNDLTVGGTGNFGSLVAEDLTIDNFANIGGDLDVGANFSAVNVTISGKYDGSAGTAVFDNDVQVEGDFIGECSFADDIFLAGSINGYGTTTVPFQANVDVFGWIDAAEASHVPFTTKRLAGNIDESIQAADFNFIVLFSATGPRAYTITDTQAVDGDWFLFTNRSTQQATVYTPGGSDDLTLDPNQSCYFVFFGGGIGWRCMLFVDFIPGL